MERKVVQYAIAYATALFLFWSREESHSPDPGMDIPLRDLEDNIPAVVHWASEGILRHYLQNGVLSTDRAASIMKAAKMYLSDLIQADTELYFLLFFRQTFGCLAHGLLVPLAHPF